MRRLFLYQYEKAVLIPVREGCSYTSTRRLFLYQYEKAVLIPSMRRLFLYQYEKAVLIPSMRRLFSQPGFGTVMSDQAANHSQSSFQHGHTVYALTALLLRP